MMSIPRPAFHIFKCQQSAPPGMPKPSCITENNPESKELMQHLSMTLMEKGIVGNVQPIQTGCLGRCQLGPVMMVEPGHIMYVNLTKEKITRIIDEHIIGGNVVQEYVVPDQMWGEPIDPATQAK